MKCLAIGLPAVDAYIENITNLFNLPAKDVKTFTELYLNKNNTDTLPSLSQFVNFLESEKLIPEITTQPSTSVKPDVILPIGTSGSGKSTFIKSLPQENLVVISPDDMRVEFTGDINNKSKDKEIYIEAANRAVQAIKQGKQVVFDTTNLTKDKRLPFIEAIKKAIPTANIQYKLMPLDAELAKQRIKAQLNRTVSAKGKMTFSYGNNKRVDIKSNTTLEAIKNGERTATTRYESDGNIDYWKNLKEGDIIEWEGSNGEKVLVEVTKSLHKLVGSNKTAEQWSKLEGWSIDYFNSKVKPKLNGAWQIEYKIFNQRANVSDETIDRHAESYKQMLEDIKSEGITNYDTTQPQAPVSKKEEDTPMVVNNHITTEANEFEKSDLLEEQEELDFLQALFYNMINTKAAGNPISKEFLKGSFQAVLDKIPVFLEKFNLPDIQRKYAYLKEILISSRLKNIGLTYVETDENVGDRNSGVESKSSVMFDPLELAKDEVVYLFNTLFSDKTIHRVKLPYEYSESMHKTMNLLGGSTSIEQQIKILQNSNLPFKDQILEKLGVVDGEQQNIEKYWKVSTSFFENFSKAKSEFHVADVGSNGNTVNTIDSSLRLSIKVDAKSKFLQSSYVAINPRNKTVIKNPKELSALTPLQFLNDLGFDILESDLNEEVVTAALEIKKVLLNSNNASWIDDVNIKPSLKGRLNTILDVLVARAKEERPLMTRNAEGESQSSVHNHSYFTRKFNDLKEKVLAPTNKLEKRIAEGAVRYTIISGATTGKSKLVFTKLSKVDLYATAMTNMFSNGTFVFSLPRTADKALEQGIEIKRDKSIRDDQGKYITEKAYMSQFVYLGGKDVASFIDDMFDEYQKDLSSDMPIKFTENFKHPKTYWEQMFKEEPVDPYTREEFEKKYIGFIRESAKDVYQDMAKSGVYEEKEKKDGNKYLATSIPHNILNKFITGNYKFTELDFENQKAVLEKTVTAYTFNSVYYGTLLAKTLYGNITGTKTAADFFKRSSSAIAETRSPNLSPKFVNWLVANRHISMENFPNTNKLRVKITSETKTPSNEALLGLTKNIVKGKNPYEKNNVDDGQGKVHFGIYREVNMLINNWTDAQDKVYNLLMNGKEIPPEYKNVTFSPLKPVAFDVVDDNGVAVPVFLKLAAYPLIPGAIKGTMNEDTYNLMTAEGIGVSGPTSIIKMARPKGKPEYSNGTAEADEDSTFDMNMRGFGIQVDINPKTSFKQLQGTQYRKLIQGNLMSNGLSEEAAKEWIKDNNELIEKLAAIEKQSLFDEIFENGDVDGKINDAGIKRALRNELLKRGASSNNISALSYIFDGVTKFIDSVPNRKKLMNIINSMVTNNIIRLFTNGSTLVQISQAGWELKPGSTVESETGIDFISKQAKQNYIDNKGLKFITYEEGDKKIGAAEILLPAKFNQFIKKDKNGNPIKDKDGYYVIDDEKCLVNIGYRIPTQGLNSILHLKVVGFLPSYMEQVVVMPKEITTQGGSDFDVDKVNLYVPNTIKYKGKVVYVDQSIVDRAEEIYQSRFEKNTANWDEAFMSKLDEGTTEDAVDYANSKVKALSSLENFKKELQKQALQNDLISQSLQILENGELTLKQLLTPNSSDILSGLAEKLYGKEPKFDYGTLFTPKTLVDITRQMYAAKALVGVFAAQSVHHALGQQVGLHFDTLRPFYFNHNKVMVDGKMRSSLSGIYKYDGVTLISEMLGNQYLTASVDAAKDPFLFLLNVNGLTANAVCAFERMGGDTEYLMSMLKVPIVSEYISMLENNNSLAHEESRLKKSKETILNTILQKYGKSPNDSEHFVDTKNIDTALATSLHDLRRAKGNFSTAELQGELSIEEQIMLLDDFLYLDDAGKVLSGAVAVSKFDVNGGGKDGIQTALILNNYNNFVVDSQNMDKGVTLNTIVNEESSDYSSFMENTFVKTFKDNTEEVTDALYNNMLFLNSNDAVKQLLFKFNNVNEGISAKKLSEEDSDALYEGILNYIVQNNIGLTQDLFVGKKSVGARVIKIQQDPNHPLHNTYIFKKLFSVEMPDMANTPTVITLKDKFVDARKQEMLEKEFNEVRKIDPQLFNDLVTVSFFQSGFTQSPSSFNHLLNNKITIDIINPILTQFSENVSTDPNVLGKLAANIGFKLQNLVRVKLKRGKDVFGGQIAVPFDKSFGKKLIQAINYTGRASLMYQLNEKLSNPEEGLYVYDPIPAKNIGTMFTNYTETVLDSVPENVEEAEGEDVLTDEEKDVFIPIDTIIAKSLLPAVDKIKMLKGEWEMILGQLYVFRDGVKTLASIDETNQYLAWTISRKTKNIITDGSKNLYYVLPPNVSVLRDSKGNRLTEILDSTLKKIPSDRKRILMASFRDEINKIAKELYLNNC
jgi:predicted kinase